jgi:hemolysin III
VALDRFPRLGGALYIVLGWAGLAALPTLWSRPGTLALIVAGGALYTLGAILFASHRPRLSERWFGYHEVWHSFGLAAGALLFVANMGLVRGG